MAGPAGATRQAAREGREAALTADELEAYRDRRRDRFRLRETARSITRHKRLGKCGLRRIDGRRAVEVRERVLPAGRVAHYANLQACGAAWVCPVCGPKVREHKAQEADAVAAAWAAHYGVGSVMLLTGTTPHSRGDRLATTFQGIKDAWAATFAGSRWQTDKKRLGVAHYMRAHDVTHGGNGWHPHFHAIILARRELTDAELEQLRGRLYARWAAGVKASTGEQPDQAHGLQLERARAVRDVARYVYQVAGGEDGKRELARELTRADLKTTKRRGQRTPWQILAAIDRAPRCDADGVESIGRARDVRLWREYETATKGSHLLQWSQRLRAEAVALGAALDQVELTDDAIAAAEVGGPRVLQIAHGHWWAVRRRRGAAALVLRLVETRHETADQLELFADRMYGILDGWREREEQRETELQRRVAGWETPADRRRRRDAAAAAADPTRWRLGDAWEARPLPLAPLEDEEDSMPLAMLQARALRDQEALRQQLATAEEALRDQVEAKRIQLDRRAERAGWWIDGRHYELQRERETKAARPPGGRPRKRRRAA